jgi:hypothetical protein
MLVPSPALTAGNENDFLLIKDQIRQDLAGFIRFYDGADRCLNNAIRSVGPGFILSSSRFTISSAQIPFRSVVFKGEKFAGASDNDASAIPSITAVWSASGDELLSSEADAAATPISGPGRDDGFI